MAWNLTGEFLFKNIVLLCVCAVLFPASLPQSLVKSRAAWNVHDAARVFVGFAPSLGENAPFDGGRLTHVPCSANLAYLRGRRAGPCYVERHRSD
jgi:hypothetical protein